MQQHTGSNLQFSDIKITQGLDVLRDSRDCGFLVCGVDEHSVFEVSEHILGANRLRSITLRQKLSKFQQFEKGEWFSPDARRSNCDCEVDDDHVIPVSEGR